jgi:hypothetical protein
LFRNSLIKGHLRQRFHATPKDGSPPFDGVLVECDAEFYKFDAVRVNGHQAASPLLIERRNVSYLQAMAAEVPAVTTHASS